MSNLEISKSPLFPPTYFQSRWRNGAFAIFLILISYTSVSDGLSHSDNFLHLLSWGVLPLCFIELSNAIPALVKPPSLTIKQDGIELTNCYRTKTIFFRDINSFFVKKIALIKYPCFNFTLQYKKDNPKMRRSYGRWVDSRLSINYGVNVDELTKYLEECRQRFASENTIT